MRRALTALFLLASAGLGLWIWAAFASPPVLREAIVTGATRALPSPQLAAVGADSQHRRDELSTIMTRPLFSPTRRPKEDAAAPAQATAPVTTLPRMTAILIDGQARSAIFDGKDRPTVIGEGGHLGPFTIQRIEPQQVTVVGPDGKRVLRTSFSNDPPPPPLAPGMPPGLQVGLPLGVPPPLGVLLPGGMPNLGLPPSTPNGGPAR